MRLNCTLFILLLLSLPAGAQKLTGIWRGYFTSVNGLYRDQNGDQHQETYKYEVQINQQSAKSVKGVTYSYRTSVFYGKAELTGMYTPSAKSLIIKETKLVELKIGDRSEPCLMTCYLDYSKLGKLEVLEGTFISINAKDKSDCGSGKIYLERVANSDFKKEDFLTKNQPAAKPETPSEKLSSIGKNPPPNKVPNTSAPAHPDANKAPSATTKSRVRPTPVQPPHIAPKTGTAHNKPVTPPVTPRDVPPRAIEQTQQQPGASSRQEPPQTPQEQVRKLPVPKVLVERENNLVKTITTSEEFIQVDLYDNGTIDNDTISFYHNNGLVVSHARLSYSPITLKFKCSKTESHHELVIVAENLGEIPPNTALMVITAPGNRKLRYEITLASNEQRNAKVVIDYVPKE